MYIKYRLAGERRGWRYFLNVTDFETTEVKLREADLGNWYSHNVEWISISTYLFGDGHDNPIPVFDVKEVGEYFYEHRNDEDNGWPFLFIAANNEHGEHRAIVVDTEAYLCMDNGETAQRLL